MLTARLWPSRVRMPVLMVTSAPGRTKRWPSLRRILFASGWKESLDCSLPDVAVALRVGGDTGEGATLLGPTVSFLTRLITVLGKLTVMTIASMTTRGRRLNDIATLSRR